MADRASGLECYRATTGAGEGPLTAFAACAEAPKWTMPSSRKIGMVGTSDAPGPGQYDVEGAHKALSCKGSRANSFPKAKAVEQAVSETPGLTYDTEQQERHIPGGVLPRSEPGSAANLVPGPEYRPRSTLSKKGAVYMGDLPAKRRPSSAPAAGRREQSSVHTADASTTSRAASAVPRGFSFGTSKRIPDTLADTPGFSYMPPSTLRPRSASCLNGHRPEESKLEVRPDPQSYSTSKPWRAPSARFGAARRSFEGSSSESTALGPGAYSTAIPARIRSLACIGAGPKARFSTPHSDDPGPGAYDPTACNRGGGLHRSRTTFARASREPHQDSNHLSHLSGERRASIIRSFFRGGGTTTAASLRRGVRLAPRRLPGRARPTSHGPGPGAFEVKPKGVQRSCVFGTAPRLEAMKQAEGPGPGDYAAELQSKGSRSAKLRPKSASSSRPETCTESGPGPGDYKVYRLFPQR